MKTVEIVREAMLKQKITQKDIAAHLGVSQPTINTTLTRRDMKFETMVKMLNYCGYTIEIKNPEGQAEYTFAPEREDEQ